MVLVPRAANLLRSSVQVSSSFLLVALPRGRRTGRRPQPRAVAYPSHPVCITLTVSVSNHPLSIQWSRRPSRALLRPSELESRGLSPRRRPSMGKLTNLVQLSLPLGPPPAVGRFRDRPTDKSCQVDPDHTADVGCLMLQWSILCYSDPWRWSWKGDYPVG